MATYTVGPGKYFTDLQTALNSVTYGDTLVLDPIAFTQNTPFVFPAAGGNPANGMITVTSANLSNLPALDPTRPWVGRVSPTNASNMPKIGIPSAHFYSTNEPIAAFAQNAQNWLIQGIEFIFSDSNLYQPPGTNGAGTAYALGAINGYYLIRVDGCTTSGSNPTPSMSNVPTNIVFDRCYIHTYDGQLNVAGIFGSTVRALTVQNSYIANIKGATGGDLVYGATGEAKTIAPVGGPGPIILINNYLESTGQCFLTGGDQPLPLTNDIPTGKAYYNTFSKNQKWNLNSPNYTPPPAAHWWMKNIFELKTGQNWDIQHNFLQYSPMTSDQHGEAFVFNLYNYSEAGAGIESIKNITIANNVIDSTVGGFTFNRAADSGTGGGGYFPLISSQVIDNITFHNNLFTNLGYPAGNTGFGETERRSYMTQTSNVKVTHNTFLTAPNASGLTTNATVVADGSSGGFPVGGFKNFDYENNISDQGSAGYVLQTGSNGFATNSMSPANTGSGSLMPNPTIGHNLVYGPNLSPADPWPTDMQAGSQQAIGFDSSNSITFQGANGANITIPLYKLGSSSPFRGKASDGTDPGVDITQLQFQSTGNQATTMTISPPNPPVTYPASAPVGVTLTPQSGTTTPTGSVNLLADNSSPTGSGTLSGGKTTITLSGLSAGTHTLSATYSGDSTFGPNSATATMTVNGVATTVTLSGPSSIQTGDQNARMNVTVKAADGSMPTGNIALSFGTFGTFTHTLASGTTTSQFTLYSLPAGTYTLQGIYPQQFQWLGSVSPTQTLQVGQTTLAPVNVSVTAATVTFGTPTIVNVTVTPQSGNAVPTGTVTVTADPNSGNPTVASGTLSGGTVSVNLGPLLIGTHPLTVTYSGDNAFATGSGSGTAIVIAGSIGRMIPDGSGLSDSLRMIIRSFRQSSESTGLAESILTRLQRTFSIAVAEALGLAERETTFSFGPGLWRVALGDAIGIADSITTRTISVRQVLLTEALGIADLLGVSVQGKKNLLVRDALALADQITTLYLAVRIAQIVRVEGLGVSDVPRTQPLSPFHSILVVDGTGLADIATGGISNLSDAIGVTDSVTTFTGLYQRSLADALGIGDTCYAALPAVAILQASWRVDTPLGRWSVPAGALGQDWWIAQGEDKQILFVPDGAPPDISAWYLRWQLRQGDGNYPPVITCDTGNGRITVLDGPNGILQLTLSALLTDNLILQKTPWYWELVRYGVGTEITLARGTLTIAPANVPSALPPALPQTYLRSLADLLGVRDVATVLDFGPPATWSVQPVDVLGLGEQITTQAPFQKLRLLAEALGCMDRVSAQRVARATTYSLLLAEALGVLDSALARSSIRKVGPADSLGVADLYQVAVQRLFSVLIHEALGLADLQSIRANFTRSSLVSDALALADSLVTRASGHKLLLSEALALADAPASAHAHAWAVQLTDSLAATDTASAHTLQRSSLAAEAIGLSDRVSAAVARLFKVVLPEALGVAQAQAVATRAIHTSHITEAIGLADARTVNRPVPRLIVVTEALGLADKEASALISGSGGTTSSIVQLKFSKTTPLDPYQGGSTLAGMASEAGMLIDPATTPSDTTITLTYQLTNAVTASLVVTGGSTQALQTDGQVHTVTYQPSISGLARIIATDTFNNTFIQPLHHIVRENLPALDPNASATVTSAQSGDWASASTWTQNRVPGRDDIVQIQNGHSITSSGRSNQCGRLLITNGTFTHTNGLFSVTDIDVPAGGTLVVGDGATTSMIMLHNRPQHANDTANFWRAVYIHGGTCVIRGPARQNPFVRLAVEPQAGDTSIKLTQPVSAAGGWKVGYTLVIPDTKPRGLFDLPSLSANLVSITDPLDGPKVVTTTATHSFHVGDRVLIQGPQGSLDDSWNPVFGSYIVGPSNLTATTFSLLHTWGKGAATINQAGATATLQFADQTELCFIRGISADGLTVFLNEPLQFAHPGQRDTDGTLNLAMMPHVGNLLAVAGFLSSDPTDRENRGHFHASGRSTIDCYGATFHGLGRCHKGTVNAQNPDNTNCYLDQLIGPVGGLPVRDGTFPYASYQYRMDSCVFLDPHPVVHYSKAKWGLAIDNASYGYIGNNVLYNWGGANFMMVSGGESYNVVENNFAILSGGTVGRGISSQPGDPCSGFYITSPLNYVRNNVAAFVSLGATPAQIGYGYNLVFAGAGGVNTAQIPSFQGQDPSGNPQVQVCRYPVLQFENNECYASLGGMEFYNLGTTNAYEGTPFTPSYAPDGVSIIKNFKVWNFLAAGAFPYPSSKVTFQNPIFWNDIGVLQRGAAHSRGFHPIDYFTDRLLVDGADIRGCWLGLGATSLTGFVNNKQAWSNCFLRNQWNMYSQFIWNAGFIPDQCIGRQLIIFNNICQAPPGFPLVSMVLEDANLGNIGSAGPCALSVDDQIYLYQHQGNPNDNFRVYWHNTDPTLIMPQTQTKVVSGETILIVVGAPSGGQTNLYWSNPANDPTGHGKTYNYGLSLLPANAVTRADFISDVNMPIHCGVAGDQIPLPYPGNGIRP